MKNTPLRPSAKPLMRKRPIKTKQRTGPPRDDGLAQRFWCETATADGCVMHGHHGGRVEGHHVITKQQLRQAGLESLWWDTRNGLGLCTLHHRRHHAHVDRLPRALLPSSVFEFAAEHGLLWLLDREYPAESEAT